jgi:hypothetical protein
MHICECECVSVHLCVKIERGREAWDGRERKTHTHIDTHVFRHILVRRNRFDLYIPAKTETENKVFKIS